jgi:glycosyltransferase involved in cell wall biosynthesis
VGVPVGYAYSEQRTSPAQKRLLADCEDWEVPLLDLKVGNTPRPRDLVAFRRLRKFVATHGFTVVHAHSFKAGFLARRLRSVPVIYTPHAYYSMLPHISLSRRVVERIERRLSRRALTVNVSPDERDYAFETLSIPEELHRMIPNCVDTERYCPVTEDERRDLRATMGVPEDAVLLGAISRLSWQKDPETLIKAFDLAKDEDPRLELALVFGADLKELKPRHDVIHFEHFDDTAPFYQALDAYVQTSRYEGLPITVLEAMATNLPMILSDAPGNRGFGTLALSDLTLVPTESAEEFAKAFVALAGRLRDEPSPCPNHRTIATDRFTPQRVYGELLDLYRQAAE